MSTVTKPMLLDETGKDMVDAIRGVAAAVSFGNGVNPNLLDNWYFGNPVNQRGQTSYTLRGQYGIDRWTGSRTVMTVESDGVYIAFEDVFSAYTSGYIMERLEGSSLAGETVTVSALYGTGKLLSITGVVPADGTELSSSVVDSLWLAVACYTNNGVEYTGFQLFTSSINQTKIKAVKLELGSTQTLAHQDADGNWVLNEIPDYGEQLARCQRYQVILNACAYNYHIFGMGNAISATQIRVPLMMMNLRVTPTISSSGILRVTSATNGATAIAVTGLSEEASDKETGSLVATVASGLSTGATYYLQANNDSSARIILDANL